MQKMVAKVDDKTSLNISLSYLIQIAVALSVAVYGYATLTEQIRVLQVKVMQLQDDKNNYIFPDIRQLETKVIKLEKEVIILQTEIEFYKKELKELKKPVE